MCNNCTIALYQRNCFEILEKTNRMSRNLSLWKLNILIDSIKIELFIVFYFLLFIFSEFYRSLDRFLDKNRCFIKRINIKLKHRFRQYFNFNICVIIYIRLNQLRRDNKRQRSSFFKSFKIRKRKSKNNFQLIKFESLKSIEYDFFFVCEKIWFNNWNNIETICDFNYFSIAFAEKNKFNVRTDFEKKKNFTLCIWINVDSTLK